MLLLAIWASKAARDRPGRRPLPKVTGASVVLKVTLCTVEAEATHVAVIRQGKCR